MLMAASGLIETPAPRRRWAEITERLRWLVLTARGGREFDAADWLRLRNVPVYWPNYYQNVTTSNRANGHRRRANRLSAVMPGYLFLPLDMVDSIPWLLINQTPSVIGFLRDGNGNAAFMLNMDIDIIRLIEAGLNTPPPKHLVHKFKTGDKVRFADDLRSRWPPGRIIRLAKSGRIGVETILLGRAVLIEVYPHQIECI